MAVQNRTDWGIPAPVCEPVSPVWFILYANPSADTAAGAPSTPINSNPLHVDHFLMALSFKLPCPALETLPLLPHSDLVSSQSLWVIHCIQSLVYAATPSSVGQRESGDVDQWFIFRATRGGLRQISGYWKGITRWMAME
uniref:Uncharacterized protein n=1 Tax=Physcomitrium patens TaxID=3218 RepID=A0A2K1JZL7_PHYPA|nr:hypothetical protein PHYPA_014091 [Physcomitrium patens]